MKNEVSASRHVIPDSSVRVGACPPDRERKLACTTSMCPPYRSPCMHELASQIRTRLLRRNDNDSFFLDHSVCLHLLSFSLFLSRCLRLFSEITFFDRVPALSLLSLSLSHSLPFFRYFSLSLSLLLST